MEIILPDGEKKDIHYQLTISETALLRTVILTLGIYHSTFHNTETLPPSSDAKPAWLLTKSCDAQTIRISSHGTIRQTMPHPHSQSHLSFVNMNPLMPNCYTSHHTKNQREPWVATGWHPPQYKDISKCFFESEAVDGCI